MGRESLQLHRGLRQLGNVLRHQLGYEEGRTSVIKTLLQFIPRSRKVRREKEIAERSSRQARLEGLDNSVSFLRDLGLPQDAAWDVALQLSGVQNTKAVLSRLSMEDWERMPGALEVSDSLGEAIRATRNASNEALRDLLARIINGELEAPDSAPRSVVDQVNRLGKRDLETFLMLRHVLWKECDAYWANPRSTIYCMQDNRSYPGLLSGKDLSRLSELGVISFGPMPFESSFPGAKAFKWLMFGGRKIRVANTKPDATLYLGHFALGTDGSYIMDLYGESCEMSHEHFEAVCAAWRNQGFEVTEADAD